MKILQTFSTKITQGIFRGVNMHCHCDLSRFTNLTIDFINFNYVYHHQIAAKISLLTIQLALVTS